MSERGSKIPLMGITLDPIGVTSLSHYFEQSIKLDGEARQYLMTMAEELVLRDPPAVTLIIRAIVVAELGSPGKVDELTKEIEEFNKLKGY